METVKLSRNELHKKVWETPAKELCEQYDVDEDGLEKICDRLNVPFPEKPFWKKLSEGKKVNVLPLPEKSFGTYHVILYKKNEDAKIQEQVRRIKALLHRLDPNSVGLADYTFDKLILSTKEGINKHWEERHGYTEKSKLLSVHVSPEMLPRALNVMDMLIKGLRFKGQQLIVEKHHTYVIVAGEKIEISLAEKNRRVEFINEYGQPAKDLHPTGTLLLKKEGSSINAKEWRDGPKKGTLEEQLPSILNDLDKIAQEQKDERERWRIHAEEQAKKEKLRHDLEERQKRELARFQDLLFEAHRFALSTMIRNYVEKVESQATIDNYLTEDVKSWLTWAKKSADWYDPTIPNEKAGILRGIDIENLRVHNDYHYYDQKERNFWKPWWSK